MLADNQSRLYDGGAPRATEGSCPGVSSSKPLYRFIEAVSFIFEMQTNGLSE